MKVLSTPPPKKPYKWLAFPVENFVREFYAKFLLAALAAEQGWASLIAYKGFLRFHLPPVKGVIVEMNLTNGDRMQGYADLCWKVCAWDEEGLLYINAQDYVHRRINPEALKLSDQVYLWGEHQRRDIQDHIPWTAENLIVTGNPRFDLLRPELRKFYAPAVDTLQNQYGRYILVNTTFGDVNHYFGRDYNTRILNEAGKLSTPGQQQDQAAREAYKENLMHAFMDMLPALSTDFPRHTIIIRPHPAENFETWRAAAQDLPNVRMVHEGDPIPWLLGAEAVIHNSCTTGVQAYLLGRPVIAYRPLESERYDMFLPNALSLQARDTRQLAAMIHAALVSPDQGGAGSDRRKLARQYIESLEGAWASERILQELEKLSLLPQAVEQDYFKAINTPRLPLRTFLSGFKGWLKQRLIRKSTLTPGENDKNWQTYKRHRFPTISLDGIQSDLLRLQQITGRFSNVRVYHAGGDLVCIHPRENPDHPGLENS